MMEYWSNFMIVAIGCLSLGATQGYSQSFQQRTASLNRAAAVTQATFVRTHPCPSQVPSEWTRLDSKNGSGWRCSFLAASWDALMLARESRHSEFVIWKFREVSCVGMVESQVPEIDLTEGGKRGIADGHWTVLFFNENPPAGIVDIDKRTGKMWASTASGESFPDYLHGCKTLKAKS